MVELIKEKYKFKIFFVESICDDPEIIEANIVVSLVYLVGILFVNQERKKTKLISTDI